MEQLREALKEELTLLLGDPEPLAFSETSPISVYLVVGVNGVGKTTSIAKLANLLKRQKHRVMLAAGDTFRAALESPVIMGGFIIADTGSKVLGRVAKAQRAGRVDGLSDLVLTLTEINTTDRQRVKIDTTSYDKKGPAS